MKVTSVKTFLIHPGLAKNWLFVKVETDEGLHGWGEGRPTRKVRDRHPLSRWSISLEPF